MNEQLPDTSSRVARTRLRIRFTKAGDLRWIGHKDLSRLWERLLRRAGLRLAFSEGFHPKPKISFPSALALGIEALDEIVELEIEGKFEIDQVRQAIVQQLPEGMELTAIEALPQGRNKGKVVGATYRIVLPVEKVDAVREKLSDLLSRAQLVCQRQNKSIVCPVGDDGLRAAIEDGALVFTLPHLAQGSIRPSEFLESLGLDDLLPAGALLQRTEVHLQAAPDRHEEETRS